MLKKHLGGLTLLAFVFTFAGTLFLKVNPANADATLIVYQPVTTYYYQCGVLQSSSSSTETYSYDFDHPEDSLNSREVQVYRVNAIGIGEWVWEIVTELSHTSHSVETRYNNSTVVYHVEVVSEAACR